MEININDISSAEILKSTNENRNKIKWNPCYEKIKK
jgi:hypothetical protein